MGDHFNENLKAARERKNMTQKEVADNIGVAKSTYSLYESGNRELKTMNVILVEFCRSIRIKQYLYCPISSLN